MEKEIIVNESKRFLVDKATGEYEELKKGDRILKRSSIEYYKEKKENGIKSFIKLNRDVIDLLIKENISSGEMKIILALLKNLRYDNSEIKYRNGSNVNIEYIVEISGINRSSVYKYLKKIEKREIIKKVGNKYIMNPYIFSLGNAIDEDLVTIFKGSKWGE